MNADAANDIDLLALFAAADAQIKAERAEIDVDIARLDAEGQALSAAARRVRAAEIRAFTRKAK